MGLGPLAFTPARNVVLGEGPSECVLLPTLLREAAKVRQLPFQVGPGAANVSKANFSDLQAEGGRVAFVLDGDAAGEKTKKALIEAGADPDQIRSYKDFFDSPIVFEDLIDSDVYVTAFNDELNRWQELAKQLTAAELPKAGRASFVDRWCQEQGRGTKILATDKEGKLKELYDWLLSKFERGAKDKVAAK